MAADSDHKQDYVTDGSFEILKPLYLGDQKRVISKTTRFQTYLPTVRYNYWPEGFTCAISLVYNWTGLARWDHLR